MRLHSAHKSVTVAISKFDRPCKLPAPPPSESTTGHTPRGHWASSQRTRLPSAGAGIAGRGVAGRGFAATMHCAALASLHFHFPPIPTFNPKCQSVQTSHVRRAAPPRVPFASLLPTQRFVAMEPAHSAQSARIMTPTIPPNIGPVTRRPALSSSRLPAVIRPQSPALTTHRHALSPPPRPSVGNE